MVLCLKTLTLDSLVCQASVDSARRLPMQIEQLRSDAASVLTARRMARTKLIVVRYCRMPRGDPAAHCMAVATAPL